MKRILIALDGTSLDDALVAFAVEIARRHAASILLATVIDELPLALASASPFAYEDPAPLMQGLQAKADGVLRSAERRVTEANVRAEIACLSGDPGSSIIALADSTQSDCIILGLHSSESIIHFFRESRTHEVVRAAKVPVFVVSERYGVRRRETSDSAIVALDSSAASLAALDFACDFLCSGDEDLRICNVLRENASRTETESALDLLEVARSKADIAGIHAEIHSLRGDAAQAILSIERSQPARFIFAGTRARTELAHLFLGSVAEELVRNAVSVVCLVHGR